MKTEPAMAQVAMLDEAADLVNTVRPLILVLLTVRVLAVRVVTGAVRARTILNLTEEDSADLTRMGQAHKSQEATVARAW